MVDRQGRTPVFLAAMQGRHNLVRLMLADEATRQLRESPCDTRTPSLLLAATVPVSVSVSIFPKKHATVLERVLVQLVLISDFWLHFFWFPR